MPRESILPLRFCGCSSSWGLRHLAVQFAHIGYFREEIVVRRRWIDDAAYTDLVALCQFLPGPASRQVGFSLGLIRANPTSASAKSPDDLIELVHDGLSSAAPSIDSNAPEPLLFCCSAAKPVRGPAIHRRLQH